MSDPIPFWAFPVIHPQTKPGAEPVKVDAHFDGRASPNVIQYGRDFRTTKVERIGGPIFIELTDGVRFIPLCSQCDCPAEAFRWSGEPLKSRYDFVCRHCVTDRGASSDCHPIF